MELQPSIFVVDDDPAVSRALASVGQLLGLQVHAFASAAEFLQAYDRSRPGCLVLDIKMPGMTGLELQRRLAEGGLHIPIVMISGHADVRIAVEALTRGAVTLLEKPFRLDELVTHIRRALDMDAARRALEARQAESNARLEELTPKERAVLDLIGAGSTNKQMAAALHLSIRAVEDRRARLMKKLGVRSLAELMQLQALRQSAKPPSEH